MSLVGIFGVVQAADGVPPTVGSITPTSAVAGTATKFTASYSDDGTGVQICALYLSDTMVSAEPMIRGGGSTDAAGTVSEFYTFSSAGTYTLQVRCVDYAGNLGYGTPTTISVSPAPTPDPLSITTSSVPSAMVDVFYNTTLAVTGGTAPYTWEPVNSASFPPGIGVNTGGQLNGYPTTAGSYTFGVKVLDSVGASTSRTYTMSVSAPAPVILEITTSPSSIPSATLGVAYSASFSATGGTTPYHWSAVSPSTLPPGIALSDSGVLNGTPVTDGTYSFQVRVTDGAGTIATRTYSIEVVSTPTPSPSPVTINTSALVDGTVGTAYTSTFLSASGGTSPYTWSVISGAVPAGLTVSSGGVVSGTPTVVGSFSFTVKASDSVGATATRVLSVTIASASSPPPAGVSITTTTLPDGTAGSSYASTLSASGGTAPYSWSIVSGALPPGLTLSSGGSLGGTPTTAGTYTVSIKVTDGSGAPATRSYTVTVHAATTAPPPPPTTPTTLSISSSVTFSSGVVGIVYLPQVAFAVGGTSPYTWSIVSGTVPPGLTFSSGGVLSGTPTTAGTYSFTAKVVDAGSQSASASFIVRIDPASSGGSSSGGSGGGSSGGSFSSGGGAWTDPALLARLNHLGSIGLAVHALVKLPDDGNRFTQADSAVYYIGGDGRRHAFPNEKVYFSWYTDFGYVRILNAADMASIPLGANITYKPGVKMVKFLTDPKVYAVAQDRTLRWVPTESWAVSLYGSTWNRQIDDISDAFYTDYRFGTEISSSATYSPSATRSLIRYPTDTLPLL